MRPGGLSTVGDTRIQQHIVNLVLADLVENILGKCLHVLQVVELQRQHGQLVGVAVVGEAVEGGLGAVGAAGAEDDLVRLSSFKELLDGVEALVMNRLSILVLE